MNQNQCIQVLRMKSAVKMLGISRSSIYNKLTPRHPSFDPSFPRPISLGHRSIGWRVADLNKWVCSKSVGELGSAQ